MKLFIKTVFLLTTTMAFSQVGINTSSPHPSAVLDLTATDKALLLSRVSNTNAITTPTNGMMVYAINPKCVKAYVDNAWQAVTPCSAVPSAITINSATYQGVSVIDTQGVGYNGEMVSSASTITLSVTVTEPTYYELTATDSGSGLVYSAADEFTTTGTFNVVLTPNFVTIPATTYGTLTMAVTGANNAFNITPRIDIKTISASATAVVEVLSGTGKIWMDRNLGATRPATSVNDPLAYGNLYQWGRGNDGHERMVFNGSTLSTGKGLNGVTTGASSSDTPGHDKFITYPLTNSDWRNPQNNLLWQGASGTNNPCPSGFRLPTAAEFAAEVTFYSVTSMATAYSATPQQFSATGGRASATGDLIIPTLGYYWSSTIGTSPVTHAKSRVFSSTTNAADFTRNFAIGVRCIKN